MSKPPYRSCRWTWKIWNLDKRTAASIPRSSVMPNPSPIETTPNSNHVTTHRSQPLKHLANARNSIQRISTGCHTVRQNAEFSFNKITPLTDTAMFRYCHNLSLSYSFQHSLTAKIYSRCKTQCSDQLNYHERPPPAILIRRWYGEQPVGTNPSPKRERETLIHQGGWEGKATIFQSKSRFRV